MSYEFLENKIKDLWLQIGHNYCIKNLNKCRMLKRDVLETQKQISRFKKTYFEMCKIHFSKKEEKDHLT